MHLINGMRHRRRVGRQPACCVRLSPSDIATTLRLQFAYAFLSRCVRNQRRWRDGAWVPLCVQKSLSQRFGRSQVSPRTFTRGLHDRVRSGYVPAYPPFASETEAKKNPILELKLTSKIELARIWQCWLTD